MFVTNGKEYVNIDSIVYITRAHFDPYVSRIFGFHVATETVENERALITFKDIYSEDANKMLAEIMRKIMMHSKHKWVVFEGAKSIYRINGLKFITNHSENIIKFATNDGVFTVYGRDERELNEYKQMLISDNQFLPENVDFSNFF